MKVSIAYSQATRLRRIFTEKSDFLEAAERLKNDLTRRGYNQQKVSEEINRAAVQNRQTLLSHKVKEEKGARVDPYSSGPWLVRICKLILILMLLIPTDKSRTWNFQGIILHVPCFIVQNMIIG